MKRIIAVILCLLLLCSCNVPSAKDQSDERIKVVTTIFPLYDFVRAVGGESVEVTLLIVPGTEVHSFDPTISDIRAVCNGDLFVYVGGESDEWVNRLLADNRINCLKMMDFIGETKEHSHDQNHHTHIDEHIWTSPKNALLMLDAVCEALGEINPQNKGYFAENCQSYKARIDAVAKETMEVVSKNPNPFILVADRFPFSYFAEYYGIDYLAAFGGCAVSTDISIKTMSELVQAVEEKGLKYAYYTELSNQTIAKALREQTGVKLLELHSAHNVKKEDFKKGITYVDICKRNKKALEEGLCRCHL